MVNYVRGLFYPAQPGHQPQRNLDAGNVIMGIALSALAWMGANACERNSPPLALALRCVPVVLALGWLFKRCLSAGHHHYQPPVQLYQPPVRPIIVHPVQPPPLDNWGFDLIDIDERPLRRAPMNHWPRPQHAQPPANANLAPLRPAPVYRPPPFPEVRPMPANVNPAPLRPAPVDRPPPFQVVQPMPANVTPPSQGRGQARTYAEAASNPTPSAPPFVAALPQGQGAAPFPQVQRTAANAVPFPAVQRAPAAGGTPLKAAPMHRGPQNQPSEKERMIFPAAEKR